MRAQSVLVAFASHTGSTAAIAAAIAVELRATGLCVECRPASEVGSLQPYDALVLGSGVFVRRRQSDGGGFLAHHATAVAERPVWLFSAGPIGGGRAADGSRARECPVYDVARSIGARGAGAFGARSMDSDADEFDRPVDLAQVRAWARTIATDLGHPSLAACS